MSAIFSPCEKYRYKLVRSIPTILRWYRPCLFIMLNPSTADAEKDDPTVRKCLEIAKAEGRTHLTIVNLYAFRSPKPEALKIALDPVGPENDRYLAEEVEKHQNSPIIAAWGAHELANVRAKVLKEKFGSQLQCIGKSKDGSPYHPLFLRYKGIKYEAGSLAPL